MAWGAVGESVVENNTVANMELLMNTAVEEGFPLVISRTTTSLQTTNGNLKVL
ncbi:hypothetical protein JCM19241_4314 [Vibrio ishigakensis]|uniref:Uncharacterized protein n=1 Tax=Vibrio ishigakensis TaxID=1481914 RepID=A0A0B8QI77_9VIBR|nr:hypothetical protein JCM19241_4314 [Vibrio ishigakensis]